MRRRNVSSTWHFATPWCQRPQSCGHGEWELLLAMPRSVRDCLGCLRFDDREKRENRVRNNPFAAVGKIWKTFVRI